MAHLSILVAEFGEDIPYAGGLERGFPFHGSRVPPPDYVVHVSERLLEDEDGPMLDLLKGFHESPLNLPTRRVDRPEPGLLDRRFSKFLELST
ncbi:MAG: putative restriction endonuclease [Solirubrobacteraceae bacterium]|nr:putative restriction endonuclease [Solirubrobacteraceae bacterium]